MNRQELNELAGSTWERLDEAIKAGNKQEVLSLAEKLHGEAGKNNDRLVVFMEDLMSYIAGINEEELDKMTRKRYIPIMKEYFAKAPSVEQNVRNAVSSQLMHGATVVITEDAEKYIVKFDPCGSGGKLRRAGKNLGMTKKGYPWSWGKAGIPYYCTHCALHWEIIPVELTGYPVKVIMLGEKPSDPCIHVFYKDPANIPEEYFTRIGKTRPR